MKLKTIYKLKGTIKCETGLAIKGMNNELSIGGADSEVVKNPITGEPYIPGSSLKGKMRSQLEKKYGMKSIRQNEEKIYPCGCGRKECNICKIFGAYKNVKAESAPTRIIVRDASLSDESRDIIANMAIEQGSYLEVKAENLITRNSGTAGAPRFIERVPAGITFNLEILLQAFDIDNHEDMKKSVEEALELVELSYLGGSGSRGYGQVSFDYKWEERQVNK